jgi:hypothetical protein
MHQMLSDVDCPVLGCDIWDGDMKSASIRQSGIDEWV